MSISCQIVSLAFATLHVAEHLFRWAESARSMGSLLPPEHLTLPKNAAENEKKKKKFSFAHWIVLQVHAYFPATNQGAESKRAFQYSLQLRRLPAYLIRTPLRPEKQEGYDVIVLTLEDYTAP